MRIKILYIGNKLSKHGFNATAIDNLGFALENEGYILFYASEKKNFVLRLCDMIYTTIKKSKEANFVLIDTYSTLSFYYTLIITQLCRILNLKYITILHGGNLPFRLKNNPFLSKIIFNNAYKLVAPSGYLFNEFSKSFSKKLILIPNSIEIKNYPFFERDFLIPKLLWVRSFASIYNPKMAIDVLFFLKKDFPSAELCMIGPDNENLVNECKLYAKSKNVVVQFTGKLTRSQWTEKSKQYNIFINTTHFDNTPVSVIEAMALGLPVVSTCVGGIPYLIENNKNGFLVVDNDSLEMANSIKEIILNRNLNQIVSINARKTIEQFDWKIIKNKWFEILK